MAAPVCQACQAATCKKLRTEEAKLKQFINEDSPAAKAVYDDPDKRVPPDGFRNATEDDLKKLNLKSSMLEHPIDPRTGKPSDFRAAVFVNEADPNRVLVAFKGTTPTSLEDWKNNVQQGLGQDSFYYNQAAKIARGVADSGADARYVGHSLGGGLASFAARLTGADATTFNAAALSESSLATVGQQAGGVIDAVSVKGEVLTSGQNLAKMLAQGDTRWPLDPPAGYGATMLAVAAFVGPKALAAAMLARSVGLHMMAQVDKSLAQRATKVAAEIKKNGC